MRPTTAFALALLALAGTTPPAAARETIVGRWGESRDVCNSGGAIEIKAMELSSEETVCEFSDVSRVEDVVTWKGKCFVNGAPPRRETVVATLHPDKRLSIAFQGSGAKIPGLSRCR
jgi:hypothetical protein